MDTLLELRNLSLSLDQRRALAGIGAIGKVRLSHPQAKVTHEAAIGSVNPKQLETLLARGWIRMMRWSASSWACWLSDEY